MNKLPYKVLTVPDPRLKKQALPVLKIDDEVLSVIDRMLITMYEYKGIGLAATQVGILKRIVVMDIPININDHDCKDNSEQANPENESQIYKMINPEVVFKSVEKATYAEGCLSVPGQRAKISRPSKIKVKYTDTAGKNKTLETVGLLATCIQHEIDHLDGILYIDYLSSLKRSMLIKNSIKYTTNLKK